MLAGELTDLRLDDYDLALTGLDNETLSKLLHDVVAPESFAEIDETLETEHACPKCGYAWSGKAK